MSPGNIKKVASEPSAELLDLISRARRPVLVRAAVAHRPASPEPDVTLSRHPALQSKGHCH